MPCKPIFCWAYLRSLRGIQPACTASLIRGDHVRYSSSSGPPGRGAPGSLKKHPAISAEKVAPHTPVMLKEVLRCLDIQPGQVFLDMTFGGGGHTKAIVEATPDVTVLALDRDPTSFLLAQQLAAEHKGRVRPLLGRFSELEVQMDAWGLRTASVDAVLLDAGCSSMQMDRPERGFSLSKDGPLDMRMDANRYPNMPCATDVVNALDQQALASVLRAYGEEKHARKIALAIVEARRVYPITRTQQLASVVAGSFSSAALYARSDRLQRPSHIATKTFQALRMFVNDELNELHAGLRSAQTLLKPGGRLCVLTFHSLEDRLVKRFLLGEDLAAPPRRSLRHRLQQGGGGGGQCESQEEEVGAGRRATAPWVPLQRGVLMPQAEDVMENPRGRSAKLRAARRL